MCDRHLSPEVGERTLPLPGNGRPAVSLGEAGPKGRPVPSRPTPPRTSGLSQELASEDSGFLPRSRIQELVLLAFFPWAPGDVGPGKVGLSSVWVSHGRPGSAGRPLPLLQLSTPGLRAQPGRVRGDLSVLLQLQTVPKSSPVPSPPASLPPCGPAPALGAAPSTGCWAPLGLGLGRESVVACSRGGPRCG